MTLSTVPRRWGAAAVLATAALIASAAPAYASPPTTPVFGAAIEALATEDPQAICDPSVKVGVAGFREMVIRTYPSTSDSGVVRACTAAEVSEHEEGRAWDWHVDASVAADRARAHELIDWLLATDSRGNSYAMARRIGIMYIIWNRQIWSAFKAGEGWRPYSGRSEHTDHVHFSFSWAGALKQTTWWTQVKQPASWPTQRLGSTGVDVQTVQHLLSAAGYTAGADGVFGPGTEAAARQFQAANGATADGVVGMISWSRLLRTVRQGDRGEAVKALQVQLNALGAGIDVDGEFGSRTANAVRTLQNDNRLPTDGVVAPALWQLMVGQSR